MGVLPFHNLFVASNFSNFHLTRGLSSEHFSTVIFFLSSLMAKQFLLLPCWRKFICQEIQSVSDSFNLQLTECISYLRIVFPILIAFGTVARIEDDIRSSVIQASLVATDLARFTVQPKLRTRNNGGQIRKIWKERRNFVSF